VIWRHELVDDSTPGILVLVVDGLGAGYLGPYGNTWIETPAVDRLAANSLLIEHAIIDTPELSRQYGSLWTGRPKTVPAGPPGLPVDPPVPLPRRFRTAGRKTVLLTDEGEVAGHDLAEAFADVQTLDPRREPGPVVVNPSG